MPRLYLLPILTLLLAGCAPSSGTQPEKVRALENPMPSGLTEKASSLSTDNSEDTSGSVPADCPVTHPQDPLFFAPEPYSAEAPFEGYFWFGSENLWTMLPADGVWSDLPHNPEGYTQKVFWWRKGYIWKEEPEPALNMTVESLDASIPLQVSSEATNAYAADIGSAMLTGVNFPMPGCWQITGNYKEAELSFVVWIAP